MLSRTNLALFAVLSLTAAACGLKGPLYRPDEARNESVSPTNPATSKKKDNSGSTPPGEQSEPPVSPPDPNRPAVPPGR
jgi:predicted small lipoprotein YifL